MGTTRVQRTGGPGGRWFLPLILALIILAIIGGVIFATRARKSSTSPTATPTPAKTTIVVTATPGPGQPTATAGTPGTAAPANAAVPPTATPGGPGISTPAPGSTAPPTVAGLQLGMITYRTAYVANIQNQVNANNSAYLFYLDPVQTAKQTLPHYGFTSGITVVSPANPSPSPTPYVGQDKRATVKVVVSYQGNKYDVFLKQPATQGPKGIWLIVTITQAAS